MNKFKRNSPSASAVSILLLSFIAASVGLAACTTGSATSRFGEILTPVGSSGGTPTIDGISCEAMEQAVFHVHAHLAIYDQGNPKAVPYGIGIGRPWGVVDSPDGPFVERGSCFYWLHTHALDGLIHIEAPLSRKFTLGNFFDIWGQPLSASQVGPAKGQIFAYLNGQRFTADPARIPLDAHAVIQLNVGTDAPPPQPYLFPSGLP